MDQAKKPQTACRLLSWPVLGLTAAGVAANILLARLASALSFPLYLDCLGTILTAALAGYIPGIAVGFATNIILSLRDQGMIYYTVLNVAIALIAGRMAQQKSFRRLGGLLTGIVSMALVGGPLGSVMTWFIYGGSIGEGITGRLAQRLIDGPIRDPFWARVLADFGVDLADKAICVLAAAAILALLPQRVHDLFNLRGWRNGWRKVSEIKWKNSLETRVVLLITLALALVAVGISAVSVLQYESSSVETRKTMGQDMARLAASMVDPDRVDAYLAEGEAAAGYRETETNLARVLSSSGSLQYVYVYRILEDGCHVVFDIDTPEMEGGEAGDLVPFDESFAGLIPDLLAGKPIDPIITDDTFGWLLTAYEPIYNSQGVCQAYAAVDVSMPKLEAEHQSFFAKILSLFMAIFILLLAVSLHLANIHVVQPINEMAGAAGDFAWTDESAREGTVERIRDLDIRTGDETENLYHALVKTAEDTAGYITDAQQKNEALTQFQKGLITIMADLVENRDKYTGDHVKHTSAYVGIIARRMREKGFYPEQLSEEYIQDLIDSAPLHDIGKIRVSDLLLNKEGRLTDEEYARMKQHTVEGAMILDSAMETLRSGGSGYLKEARNLALYHHEKWDGSGYPRGLKGEEIPLGARIMAVADVFDALVSRRSYKEPLSIEEAMEIIRKGSGSHFDPKVVEAFLECEKELRVVRDRTNK